MLLTLLLLAAYELARGNEPAVARHLAAAQALEARMALTQPWRLGGPDAAPVPPADRLS